MTGKIVSNGRQFDCSGRYMVSRRPQQTVTLMVIFLAAQLVDGSPSVYWIASLTVLVIVHVDEILAVGAPSKLEELWKPLHEHVDVDEVGSVGRLLGKYHIYHVFSGHIVGRRLRTSSSQLGLCVAQLTERL